jgi:hypothetical protein
LCEVTQKKNFQGGHQHTHDPYCVTFTNFVKKLQNKIKIKFARNSTMCLHGLLPQIEIQESAQDV